MGVAIALVVLLTVAIIALLIGLRPGGLRTLGRICVLAGVGMLPWTAVQIGGVPVADLALALAIVPLLCAAVGEHMALPPVVFGGAALVALAGFATSIWPPTSAYLSGRYTLQTFAIPNGTGYVSSATRSTGNLVSLGKYEVALLVVPFIAMLACSAADGVAFARRLGAAWVAGITVNAVVAITDDAGITHFSMSLLGFTDIGGRQAGLTSQPNHIGVQTAMVVPVILFGFMSGRGRIRAMATVSLVLCVAGVFLSESRGASVGIVFAVVATIIVAPRARAWAGRALLAFLIGGVLLLYTAGGSAVLSAVRLGEPSAGVLGSDAERASSRAQGWADFDHSPLHGIGWGHAIDAHLVILQVLAAGGLLGLLGVGLYVGGLLTRAWRLLRREDQFAAALVASTLTWITVGLVENQLTDQYVYLPLALLAVLLGRQMLMDGETRSDQKDRELDRPDVRTVSQAN